jgi:hypothetical protein
MASQRWRFAVNAGYGGPRVSPGIPKAARVYPRFMWKTLLKSARRMVAQGGFATSRNLCPKNRQKTNLLSSLSFVPVKRKEGLTFLKL